jgi:hypothetical protein
MKKLLIASAVLLLSSAASAQTPRQDFGLPELHRIKTATLSPSYSCRSGEDFQKGYESTALFLSDYSKKRNSPDLLFNGACEGPDYFLSSTAGDDMALITDLGSLALEDLNTHQAFINAQRIHSFDLYSKFARSVKLEIDHTYAVLLNKRELRGLFFFTVVGYVPHQKVDLRYAVKKYQILSVTAESPGFDWVRKNEQTEEPEVKKVTNTQRQ